MPAYIVSEVSEVLDSALMEDYRRLSQAAIEQYGGRYIIRGGAGEPIEGHWPPERIVMVEFPTADQARAWYRSPEYAKALEISRVALKRKIILVEGVLAKTAHPRT